MFINLNNGPSSKLQQMQNIQKQIATLQDQSIINKIIEDGIVTSQESAQIGLSGRYDVSTQEGTEIFNDAIDAMINQLKAQLDELKQEINDSVRDFGI